MHGTFANPTEAETSCGILRISLDALVQNYRALQKHVGKAAVAAVVKADAYGLGAGKVAPALAMAGCRDFFVAHLSEALALHPALPRDARLFVLNGLMPGAEPTCADAGIIPVLNSIDGVERWSTEAAVRGGLLPAVLQFDTGMSRLGMSMADAGALAMDASLLHRFDLLFVMSHLASADTPDNPQNAEQLDNARLLAARFPNVDLSFANSGAVYLGKDFHGTLVRPGIALYGGAPTSGSKSPLLPVVRLDVRVIQTRTVPAGARIGYSGTYTAPADMRLATIAAGYADGLPRSLSNRGAAYYGETRLPIVGRVSMDSIILDISALPPGELRPGALVEIIGPHQTLEEVAGAAGTISYEILTQLGRRYHRQYL